MEETQVMDEPVMKVNIRICLNCHKNFIPKRYWQRFDSAQCRRAYWEKENPRLRQVKVQNPELYVEESP